MAFAENAEWVITHWPGLKLDNKQWITAPMDDQTFSTTHNRCSWFIQNVAEVSSAKAKSGQKINNTVKDLRTTCQI